MFDHLQVSDDAFKKKYSTMYKNILKITKYDRLLEYH